MKTLIVAICILLLISCGRDAIELGNPDSPFIVYKVTTLDSTRSNYYSHFKNGAIIEGRFTDDYIRLVMPSNMFAVGDTISIDIIKAKRKMIKLR